MFWPRLKPARLLALVPIYFAATALAQYMVSDTADLDQAEQLMLSQDWRLGYSAQPPLYTWLVRTMFLVTGPSLAALFLLRVLLLTSVVGLLIALGREFSFTARQHRIAVFGLALIPQFIWESQRDLTHSMLAMVLAAATLLQAVKIQRKPVTMNYIVFGLLAGMGLLSKYNYALFLASVIATIALTPGYRRKMSNYRALAGIGIAAAVVAPHAVWALENMDIAGGSLHKLKAVGKSYAAILGDSLISALAFLTPLWLVSIFLIGDGFRNRTEAQRGDRKFLANLFVVTLSIVIFLVLTTGTQEIRSRWYQPLLFFAPLMVALYASPAGKGLGIYGATGMLAALVAMAALPARTIFAERLNHYSRPNVPYQHQAQRLYALTGPAAVIFAENDLLGGNMRLVFRQSRIVTQNYQGPSREQPATRLVVCETQNCQNGKFKDWLRSRHHLDVDSLQFNQLEAPYLYAPSRKHTISWSKAGTASGR